MCPQRGIGESDGYQPVQTNRAKPLTTHLKMLRILEEKGLIVRSLGSEDRRQMYFHLTHTGKQRVNELELDKVEIPDLLKPLFK